MATKTNNKTALQSPSEQALNALVSARVPVMLVSEPGMAKTATVRALSKEMGYDLVTVVPSRMEPQDISGFPTKGTITYTDAETGEEVDKIVTEYAPQMWQEIILQKRKVILFFDEFSNAAPGVRASLLSFIQDRQFPNGEYLPDEVPIVCAMNPTSSAADGYELDPATCNRIGFISWNPSYMAWIEGMKVNFGQDCSEHEMEWRQLIARFIADQPGFLHKMNVPGQNANAMGVDHNNDSDLTVHESAWPSRRSWDNLAKALGAQENLSFPIEDLIMRGIVGTEAAMHFRKWIQEHAKLDVAGIIKNPDKFKEWDTISTEDVAMILRASIDGANKDNIYNVMRIFEILLEHDRASTAASYISSLSSVHHSFVRELSKEEQQNIVKEMFRVIGKYKAITKND